MTPGGDKNGADITMALDALEMAFTHDHINAFVIVGGDSDFISLVEKLKQYGRKVIVVGGRQFTSVTMQKNCHEFIAYENLVGNRGRPSERGGRPAVASSDIAKALPIVKRALKVLSEREVTPQLGLLKSTLLQLDSTFSERDYGASSFRDFMEKVAQSGAVTLKHAGRSMLVETREDGVTEVEEVSASLPERPAEVVIRQPAHAPAPEPREDEDEEAMPASPMTNQDGIRAVQRAIHDAQTPPRFPMYVRQAKQFLRSAIEGFDERKYGFASVVDLLRAAGKEGVLRIERDRQGAVRVFPGPNLVSKPAPRFQEQVELDETIDVEVSQQSVQDAPADETVEEVIETSIIEPEPVDESGDETVLAGAEAVVEEKPKRSRARKTTGARASKTAKPRARKPARAN
jgi:hypothetical protein